MQKRDSLKSMLFRASTVNIFCVILLFIGLVLSTSCRKSYTEGGHPLFVKAGKCFEKGDYVNAIELYKSYLKINPDSAKANCRLAVIYQEQSEYIQAIFYYEKYLALEPNSSDRKIIEKWISFSKEQLFKKLWEKYRDTEEKTEKPVTPNADHEKELLVELNRLKIKNEKMRDFILRHKDVIYAGSIKKAEKNINKTVNENNTKEPVRKGSDWQFYVVEPGDTFYGISKKFYGTTKYYKLLLEKNRELLKSPINLVPGDKLIIPPKPENQ
jgi:tetratricopeptide (TPR) repeat protein